MFLIRGTKSERKSKVKENTIPVIIFRSRLEILKNMAAYGVPYADKSSWNQGVLDVLVPHQSLHNLEYIEYNRDFIELPDYKFEIRGMNALINGESELTGERFLLRNSIEFAQILCRVSFSDIRLSLAVFHPSSSGMPIDMPTKLVAIIKQINSRNDVVLTCDVRSRRYSGRFYTFCSFIYNDRLKEQRDSLVIHLYAKRAWETIPTQVLRWKVDCSNIDIMNDLGLTPLFYADSRGFQIQIRLFLRSEQVAAEFRFSTGINELSKCNTEFSIKLIVINPVDQRLNIVHPFNFHEWFKLDEWNKVKYRREISTISEIVNVRQVLSFLKSNKLMVKVKLIYFD